MPKGLIRRSEITSLVLLSSDITLDGPWPISILKDGINYENTMNNSRVFRLRRAPEEKHDKKE